MADYPALDIELLGASADGSLADLLYAALDDLEPLAIHTPDDDDRWRVFFRDSQSRQRAASRLSEQFGAALTVAFADVPDEDWARRSQAALRAVQVGRLHIAPPWDVPHGTPDSAGADFPVIVIEPSMGFGTGHHATTRLCLEMLQALDLRGARLVDVGTGSGVLALAGWKLGAADVAAIDNDPDALENARANAARNGAGGSVDIILDDLSSLRLERADIVTANLTGAVLVKFCDEIAGLLLDGGYLIASGFAPGDVPIIRRAFGGLELVSERAEGEWAALMMKNRQKP